jgi:sugar-specific transcriptional regulator TrmB
MNNFVFSQDPLLYNVGQPQQYISQNDMDIKRQLDTVLAQYQALQQKQAPTPPEPQIEDHLGNLDEMVRTADPAIMEALNSHQEFIQINNWIQQMIQMEIMKSVKHTLNVNPEVISKISRARDIIREVRVAQETEDRKSLNELNDYITNYSDMTFNEYKQFKLSKQKQS